MRHSFRLSSVLFTLLAASAAAQAGEAERARFQAEYPDALRRWQNQYAQVKAEFTVQEALGQGSPRAAVAKRETRAHFAADGGFEKVESEQTIKGGQGRRTSRSVVCQGNGTAFTLTQRPGAERYTVSSLGDPALTKSMFNLRGGDYAYAAFKFLGQTLSEIQSTPTSQLLSVETVPPSMGGGYRVEVVRGKKPQPMTFVLDPDANWAIRRVEMITGPPTRENDPASRPTVRFEVEYGPPVNGLPVPRVVRRFDNKTLGVTTTIDSLRFEPTPAAEFTLAHYGLSAPPREGENEAGASAPSRLVPWLVGLGVAGVAGAVGLYRLASGKSAAR